MNIYLIFMLLAGITESVFLFCTGYRKWKFLLYVFCINLFTNLLTNLAFETLMQSFLLHIKILEMILEISVVFSEFGLIGLFDKKWSFRLFVLIFLANLISYSIGVILQMFYIL